MQKSLLLLALSTLLFSKSTFSLEFDNPIPATVLIQPNSINHAQSKKIFLMNYNFTRDQILKLKPTKPLSSIIKSSPTLPSKADLGMNSTPVLDQGEHGTCVTFATVAAIDALLGKGDYVSPLCTLTVGNYLQKNSFQSSGWNGSFSAIVMGQLLNLGIVSTDNQKLKSCGGLKEYPTNTATIGEPMSLEDYHAISVSIKKNIWYRPIVTLADRLSWGEDIEEQSAIALQKVKEAIVNKPDPTDRNSNGRLTFAVLFPVNFCNVGACAKYHSQFDTWALTDAIKADPFASVAGHEMIITGYDDNAIAVDNEGKTHQGLLILRNSWGKDAGDQGTYYMSYEFFRYYLAELQQIVWIPYNF